MVFFDSPTHRLDDYFPEMALDHFLRLDHLTPSIIAATGTGPMQQLRIAAICTLHHLGLGKATVVLAAPLAGARLRELSLRVGHDFSARVIVFVVAKSVG